MNKDILPYLINAIEGLSKNGVLPTSLRIKQLCMIMKRFGLLFYLKNPRGYEMYLLSDNSFAEILQLLCRPDAR